MTYLLLLWSCSSHCSVQLLLRMSDHIQSVTHELLVRELCKVTEWEVLGIYLGLDESEITDIERDHMHQSNARRRIAMLKKWMEKDPGASWEKVRSTGMPLTDKTSQATEGKVLHL